MKRLNLICISLVILFNNVVYPQHTEHLQDIHKYLTYQAWELVKNQYPEVIYSEMNLRIGHWQDGTINGTGPWQKGKVITGAYREDEEDPVYKHSWPFTSATHFWDADHGDDVTFTPPPFTHNYANSYKKILAYWYGNLNNEAWLELGPFFYLTNPYYIKVKYNDLSEAYKNHSNFLVTHWYDISIQNWVEENPPLPIIPYLMENSPGYSQAEAVALVNRICWEIVGRILHHIGDSGVPAHAHNDPHPNSDYFEDVYMPAHFLEYTWIDALNQGGLVNINNKQYPLRFSLYTTNQIADRFKSDDYCGDLTFPYSAQYTSDNYESIINPMYQSIYVFPCTGPESVANIIAQKSFVYSIRSSAGFLWYVYNKFNIQTQALPVIHGFSSNLPDNTIYRGETLKLTCNASGSNLNYHWFYKVCNVNNWCTTPISGLSFNQSNSIFTIKNNSFNNRWTCSYYDSICNYSEATSPYESPLRIYAGVTVSNQFAQITKYYNLNQTESIHPYNGIRPPIPPITGCPVLFAGIENGFTSVNNVLNRSTYYKNIHADIEDKIVIVNKPFIDTTDNTISFAINESAEDRDFFDKISLVEVVHPEGFLTTVTEYNDIALISINEIRSPEFAEINGIQVTDILAFDTLYNVKVKGEEEDIINIEFKTGARSIAKETLTNELINANYSLSYIYNLTDSVALILDPSESDKPVIINQKRPAGFISVTDTAGIKITGDIEFARRQRSSLISLPLLRGIEISHASLVFKDGFDLSYCAAATLFFGGFEETELKLVQATNSSGDNVLKKLIRDDKTYEEIDSSSFIVLKFKLNEKEFPRRWVRDYVMIIKGRTEAPGSDYGELAMKEKDERSISKNNPGEFELSQNYPNPFNPFTLIKYSVPSDLNGKLSNVRLSVYDNLGKEVAVLINESQTSGNHEVKFDGTGLPSGIYYYKLTADNYVMVRKMMLVK